MSRRVTSSQLNLTKKPGNNVLYQPPLSPENMKMVGSRAMKAAVVGLAAMGAGVLLYGSDRVSLAGGMSASAPAVFFTTGAGTSMLADIAHDYYNPAKPHRANKLSDLKTLAVGGAIAGAAFAGIAKLTEQNVPVEALLPAFGLGAGAYIVRDVVEAKLEDAWNW